MRRTPLIAALVVLAVTGGPAYAAGPDALGIYAEEVTTLGPAQRDAQLAVIAAAGFGLVRSPLYWADVERTPGHHDFGAVDGIVGALARRGLRWLPMLMSTPPFRAGGRDADADGRSYHPPAAAADLAAFATVLVRRYGRGGTFWAAHPHLPARPVTSWQVWNEPNLPYFWRSGPDPEAYAALLRVTADAIHAVDRSAEVVAAGLPDSASGMSLDRFLAGFYAAGGAGSYDALAVHAYSTTPAGAVDLVRGVRERMRRAGDGARLWITEVGWATGGVRAPLTVDPDRQAHNLVGTLRALADARADLDLRGVVLFKWRDTLAAPGERDLWPHHSGLIGATGVPKPALAAVAAALPGVAQRFAGGASTAAAAKARARRGRCVSRRVVRVRVRLRRGERLAWSLVHVEGRPTRRVVGQRVRVDLRGLRRGVWGVGIAARTTGGRLVTAYRAYRTCSAGR